MRYARRVHTLRIVLLAAISSFAATIGAASCTPRDPSPIAEGEGEGEGEDCLRVGVGPVRFSFRDDVSTHYEAQLTTSLDTPVPDHLVLQFFNYNERIGDSGIGAFSLNDEINNNYGHCMECLLVLVDQLQPNDTPTTTFFQSAGTITLTENPRESANLFGSIRGLKLVETTIGGESFESAPVPGGACLVIDDIDLDLRYVPANWTCEADRYDAGDGVCDCDCGDVDADCFVGFGEPPPPVVNGCDDGQACTFEFAFPGAAATPVCIDTCDVLVGEGCTGATVCSFADPQDLCQKDLTTVDTARLGEACGTDFHRSLCNVVNTVPAGLCNNGDLETGEGRVCQPLCRSAADCNVGQFCYTVVGGGEDGTGRGYCADGTAP